MFKSESAASGATQTQETNDKMKNYTNGINFAPTKQEMPIPHSVAVEELVAAANSGWADPLPLVREEDAEEEFPIDALAPHLDDVASLLSDRIKVPTALAGQAVLGAATLAAQKHADVSIFGQVRPISSNFLTVAKSGDRKSGVDRAALRPHRSYERNLKDEYKNANLDKVGTKLYHEPMLMGTAPKVQGVLKQMQTQSVLGIYAGEGGRFLGSYAFKAENLLHTITTISTCGTTARAIL